jgi:hypothetical protein
MAKSGALHGALEVKQLAFNLPPRGSLLEIRINVACNDRPVILSDEGSKAENAEGEMCGDDAVYKCVGTKVIAGYHPKNIIHRLDVCTLRTSQAGETMKRLSMP